MSLANEPGAPSSRAVWRRLLGFALLSVAFAVLGLLARRHTDWSREACLDFVRHLGMAGPLAVLVFGALSPLAFLPRWPLAAGCGILYGLGWGGLLANVASTLGAWLQFVFVRSAVRPAAERFPTFRGDSTMTLPPRKALALLVGLRLFPLSSFVVTNMLAASSRLSVCAYILGTFVGMLPSTLMYGAWGRMATRPEPSSYAVAALLLMAVGILAWTVRGLIGHWARNVAD